MTIAGVLLLIILIWLISGVSPAPADARGILWLVLVILLVLWLLGAVVGPFSYSHGVYFR